MATVTPPPLTGTIVFTNNYLPPLEDGTYQLTVQQTLLNTNPQGTWDQINESYQQTRTIAVQGERFTLNPGEMNAFFPPANNQGEYSNVLPHAVFSRKTLLWERTPDGTVSGRTWLALLLFDANDPPPPVQTIQVGDLGRQPFVDPSTGQTVNSSLPANAVSYPDAFALLKETFALEYGQSWTDQCQAIDVPVTLWNQIAPSLDDLQWLGHARTVTGGNKAGNGGDGPQTYSVVIGNRTPTPNTKCTVHLVSLEGMAPYLPVGDDYQPASINLPNGSAAGLIRLVSLQNWSFTSVDPTESFEGYLTSLSTGPFQRVVETAAAGTTMPTDPNGTVTNAFAMGYTAVNHATRQGDQTVSWYRGPLVPFQPPGTIFIPAPDPDTNLPAQQINTADELVRYDPNTGMMDVSYAAAWELGRLLACQNKSFSVALYNWKNANVQETAQSVARAASVQQFGALGLEHLGEVPALQHAIAGFIHKNLVPHLIPRAGQSSSGASSDDEAGS